MNEFTNINGRINTKIHAIYPLEYLVALFNPLPLKNQRVEISFDYNQSIYLKKSYGFNDSFISQWIAPCIEYDKNNEKQ